MMAAATPVRPRRTRLAPVLLSKAMAGSGWAETGGVPSSALRYGAAVISVAAVTLIRLLLNPSLGGSIELLLYIMVVMFSAWYGGLKPGLFATFLGVLAAHFLL